MNMEDKFNFFTFLDEARWKAMGNCENEYPEYPYDIPNFADKNAKDEVKVLTLFLGYIVNRQIKSEKIFETFDYIFSRLAKDFVDGKEVDSLLSQYCDGEEKNIWFKCKKTQKHTAQYPNSPIFDNTEELKIKSRFPRIDRSSIRLTLTILAKNYDRNILKFIKTFASETNTMNNLINAFTLLAFNIPIDGAWVNESDRIKALQDLKQDAKATHSKRITCFLNDLIKLGYFRKIISENEITKDIFPRLEKDIHSLNVPGDVWNNNTIFRKCFLKGEPDANKSKNFYAVIRNYYEKSNKKQWYPLQLDCTFDFVPRMCEKQNQTHCSWCPLNNKNNEIKIPKEMCFNSKNEDNFCPFLLISCGYKTKCSDIKFCPNKIKK
ncbi:MAG: hypothetical protein IKD09_08060 [Lentisphaeria bacterium]|nr:hypothetical protein [Lentisphaeria bacterium]